MKLLTGRIANMMCDRKVFLTYTDLLIQYQPKLIKTEEEYQRALTIVVRPCAMSSVI
ncbi:hypothetical protein [Scytonema sp. NUACC26]|uniref:hypothetical protein n=1 Tax=Scytonema sp. NUACC26 TaxID=3140176 RepID=UPI0038B2E091